MSANKFENQVQQKMDELRLQPTAQVWEEVERRIREKKRRRVIFFWLLFGGLLLSGGGAFWLLSKLDKNEIAIVTGETKNNGEKKASAKEADHQNPINSEVNKNLMPQNITEQESTNPIFIKQKKPTTDQKYRPGNELIVENNLPGSKAKRTNQENIEDKIESNITDPKTQNDNVVNPGHVKNDKESLKSIDRDLLRDKLVEQRQTVALSETQDTKKETDSATIAIDSSVVKPQKNKQAKNKWEIGVAVSVGRSKLTDGAFASFGAKSADAYASQNTGGVTGNPPINNADSVPLKGASFQLGISAKKMIGKQSAFSLGLNLAYYSTNQRTGGFKDSIITVNNSLRSQTLGGFYSAGNINTYHNKYYCVQLPLLIHWQINRGDKLPSIVWANGLTPSLLFSSDAVAYDQSRRIFYKDRRIYNSFNLAYQTSLSVRLLKDKKHPLDLAIYYNYHFSKLQKIDPPNHNYLSSYGIKLNWVIKK